MAAARRDDTADRDATNDAAPEEPRGIPRQDGEFPRPGEAGEECQGYACPDASPPISAQHEELADLANAPAGKLRTLTDESEARRLAGDPDDEVLSTASPPELSMPVRRRERAVRFDTPAVTTEIVDVKLNQSAHERHVRAS